MTNLLSFIGRRLLASLGVLVGVSIVIFVIARVIPGDPARIALGPMASAAQVEALRRQLYLDRPLPLQYYEFVKRSLRGDLGVSLYTNRPVVTEIAQSFPATFELMLYAGLMMVVLGVPVGVISAYYRNRWPDAAARVVSLLGVTTPTFVWAIFLMLLFSYALGWLPTLGRPSFGVAPPPRGHGAVHGRRAAGRPGRRLLGRPQAPPAPVLRARPLRPRAGRASHAREHARDARQAVRGDGP